MVYNVNPLTMPFITGYVAEAQGSSHGQDASSQLSGLPIDNSAINMYPNTIYPGLLQGNEVLEHITSPSTNSPQEYTEFARDDSLTSPGPSSTLPILSNTPGLPGLSGTPNKEDIDDFVENLKLERKASSGKSSQPPIICPVAGCREVRRRPHALKVSWNIIRITVRYR
jgi:hypothetical protein